MRVKPCADELPRIGMSATELGKRGGGAHYIPYGHNSTPLSPPATAGISNGDVLLGQ